MNESNFLLGETSLSYWIWLPYNLSWVFKQCIGQQCQIATHMANLGLNSGERKWGGLGFGIGGAWHFSWCLDQAWYWGPICFMELNFYECWKMQVKIHNGYQIISPSLRNQLRETKKWIPTIALASKSYPGEVRIPPLSFTPYLFLMILCWSPFYQEFKQVQYHAPKWAQSPFGVHIGRIFRPFNKWVGLDKKNFIHD